ncbi:hypothetical protein [Streptomyces sp. NRRL S-87]|uniref:hypothetical protein n=1 Tax=Streptomyces sp. NRRL S-87 TaxID=1463920 RepID=UPI0004C14689|nr:hypothetical protein [Streptomyces sp. NRRL S-87]
MATPWMIELKRVDWDAYDCYCGGRGHVGDYLAQLIQARSEAEMAGASLEGHVEDEAGLAPVAAPAVGVIMAAFQEDLAPVVRQDLMLTLWRVVLGASEEPLADEVYPKVRDGIWALYKEAAQGDTESALEILEYVERDTGRFAAFKKALQSRLDKRAR